MPDSFQLETIVAAEPQRVFSAWMDGREHAAFTGGGEAVVEPWTGGRFIAWDGYIHGILLGVDEGRRIVQTWRTSEFPPEFSRLAAGGRIRADARRDAGGGPPQRPAPEPDQAIREGLERALPEGARALFCKGGKQKTAAPIAPETSWGRKQEPARRPQKGTRTVQKAAARKAASKPARRRAAPKPKSGSRRTKR